MSNDVDILLLDGPSHGFVVCTNRPVPAEITVLDFVYDSRIVTEEGLNYRVALAEDSEWSDDTIHMHIRAREWQPSWDLNPPFTQMPVVPSEA